MHLYKDDKRPKENWIFQQEVFRIKKIFKNEISLADEKLTAGDWKWSREQTNGLLNLAFSFLNTDGQAKSKKRNGPLWPSYKAPKMAFSFVYITHIEAQYSMR